MANARGVARLFEGRIYYGWVLLPIAFVCYGLAISPSYGSWGFYAPTVREELGLSRTQVGAVASVFTLFYQVMSPIAAILISRFGLRATIAGGCLTTALGQWLVSHANSLVGFLIFYAMIAGSGVAMSSVLPMQTLATYWFKRFRGLALAVIMAGSTTMGSLVAQFNEYFLDNDGWRAGWQFYAVLSVVTAAIVAVFIRNRPEDLGLNIDGAKDPAPSESGETLVAAHAHRAQVGASLKMSSVREAILTPQFALITLCSLGQVGCWTVFTAHGPLHLSELALSLGTVTALLTYKDLMSTTGRFLAGIGDYFRLPPKHMLSGALMVEMSGIAALVWATNPVLALGGAILLGLGHGMAFICIPLTFAQIFGRELFVHTAGISRMIQGMFTAGLPVTAGMIADRVGTYEIPFLSMAVVCAIGAIGIQLIRPLSDTAAIAS